MDRRGLALVAAFAAAALLYTGPGFLPGRILLPLDQITDVGVWKPDPALRRPVSNRLLSDAVLQFHPWDTAARRSIAWREFPFVNPFAGDGQHLFANPQAALLCPFTWPRLIAGPRGWVLTVFAKIVCLGLGVFVLAREMGASSPAAVLSGLVASGCGFSVLWGLHPHTNVFAAFPWLAAALLRRVRAPSPRNTLAVAAAAFAATIGGHPETLAAGVVSIGLFVAWETLAARPRPAGLARRLMGAAAAAACGFLLAGVQLVAFFLVLSESRVVTLRSGFAGGGLRLVAVIAQVVPGFLGSPLAGELDFSGISASAENFNSRGQGFVGAIVLVLLALSARRLVPTFRRGLIVGAVALALAWRVPPFEQILARVPLLSLGARQYWMVVFALFASAAAGPAVFDAELRIKRRWAVALSLAGLLLLAAGLAPSLPPARAPLVAAGQHAVDALRASGKLPHSYEVYQGRLERYVTEGRWTALRRLALPGACWAVAGWALLAFPFRRRFLVAALLGEITAFGVGYLPAVRLEDLPDEAPAIGDLKRLDPEGRAMIASGEGVYPANLATLDRVHDIVSFDVLEDARRTAWLESCGYQEAAHAFRQDASAPCLAAHGVRFFLSRQPLAGTARVGGAAPPAVGVYEIPGARPAALAANAAPRGLGAGALVTLVAAVSLAFLAIAARPSLTPTLS